MGSEMCIRDRNDRGVPKCRINSGHRQCTRVGRGYLPSVGYDGWWLDRGDSFDRRVCNFSKPDRPVCCRSRLLIAACVFAATKTSQKVARPNKLKACHTRFIEVLFPVVKSELGTFCFPDPSSRKSKNWRKNIRSGMTNICPAWHWIWDLSRGRAMTLRR